MGRRDCGRPKTPGEEAPRSPRKSCRPLFVAPAVHSKRLNVLVVSVQFPYPPRSGVNMRVYQLLRQLGRRHRVTLLTYALPDDAEGIAALREQLPVHTVERRTPPQWVKRFAQLRSLASGKPFASREVESPELQAAVDTLCAGEAFDVIQLEGSLLSGLRFPAGPALVLDEHNIEWEVFRRMCEGERSLCAPLQLARVRAVPEVRGSRLAAGARIRRESAREEPVVRRSRRRSPPRSFRTASTSSASSCRPPRRAAQRGLQRGARLPAEPRRCAPSRAGHLAARPRPVS